MRNENCKLCPLHETSISVCLGGTGTGKILLVGSGPSASEDAAGQAFVGKTGSMLGGMLADAGYGPTDWRFTNSIRCRAPKGRKPSADELAACSGYLRDEILDVKPKAIIALGDVALRALCKTSGVKSRRGSSLHLHPSFGYECEVWPTLDPKIVLFTPQSRASVVTDLRRVKDLDREDQQVTYTTQIPTGPLGVVAWDIETDFDYKTKSGGDTITQWAMCWDSGTVVLHDIRGSAELLSRSVRTVTHNGWAFDVPRMQGAGEAVPWGDDTLVLAYLDDETQPLNLEALCVKYLGVKGWKEGRDAEPNSPEFDLYNARDAVNTLHLYERLTQRLGNRKRIADSIIFPAFLALRDCSSRGLYISGNGLESATEHFERKLAQANAECSGLSSGRIQNANSRAQVGAALVAEGHSLPRTDDGGWGTGSSVLSSLEQTPLVEAVRRQRIAAKAINAFIRPYAAAASGVDHRVHPEYTVWKTTTGRTSARDLNVQQLGRDPLLRGLIGAPPGAYLTTVDYATIELRVAAFVAGEKNILARYGDSPLWDAHSWFARILYGREEITPHERQIAKSANFGLLYMATAETLQAYTLETTGIKLSIEECRRVRKLWHQTFPAFNEWYFRTGRSLRDNDGYIETITGRRRHFGRWIDIRGRRYSAALREAVNMQVQSPAADIALIGLAACHAAGLPINGFYHDAISFEHTDGLDTSRIEHCMVVEPKNVLKRDFGVDFWVPLVIESKTIKGDTLVTTEPAFAA